MSLTIVRNTLISVQGGIKGIRDALDFSGGGGGMALVVCTGVLLPVPRLKSPASRASLISPCYVLKVH